MLWIFKHVFCYEYVLYDYLFPIYLVETEIILFMKQQKNEPLVMSSACMTKKSTNLSKTKPGSYFESVRAPLPLQLSSAAWWCKWTWGCD